MALPENGWFSSLTILTATTFMVTSTSNVSPVMPTEPRFIASAFPPVIQIYSFAPDPDHIIIPVQPLDSDFMDDTTARPVLIAQLELPRFAPGVIIGNFDVRPDPAFPPSRDSAGVRKSFTQDPSKGILVFDLQVMEPMDPPQEYVKGCELFVLRETLVDIARKGEEELISLRKQDGEGNSHWRVENQYPWAEWGETGARMLDMSMNQRSWVSWSILSTDGFFR